MLIDNRLRAREMRPGDQHLPCTGSGDMMATLEVLDRPILRGNRSRIALIAGDLDARIDGVTGQVEALVLRFGVPAEEAARTWVPSASGKLLVIACFGADLFCVHRREACSKTMAPAMFASGDEILLGLRSHRSGTAEVVLILDLPK